MGAMKNLAQHLSELQEAEVRLLKAAKWTAWCPSLGDDVVTWHSPDGKQRLTQDEAVKEVKRIWASKPG